MIKWTSPPSTLINMTKLILERNYFYRDERGPVSHSGNPRCIFAHF
jgi:hypothetical protein